MGTSQSIKAPGLEDPAYRLRYMAVRLTDSAMGVGKDYSGRSMTVFSSGTIPTGSFL